VKSIDPVEEQALLGTQRGLRRTQQVHERGDVSAVFVRTGRRLFKLLRVAQQDQVAGRAGRGQRLSQRHLRGLVDDQHVRAANRIGVGPQPGGAAGNVPTAMRPSAAGVVLAKSILSTSSRSSSLCTRRKCWNGLPHRWPCAWQAAGCR